MLGTYYLVIVSLVTGHALGRSPLIHVVLVTLIAQHRRMRTGQRKLGLGMVKR